MTPWKKKGKEEKRKEKIVLQLAALPLQSENRDGLQWSAGTPRL